jgi:hypothetical protein
MSGAWLIALEAALVIGVVFGFGVWQLWSLRRERQRDAQAPTREPGDRPDA